MLIAALMLLSSLSFADSAHKSAALAGVKLVPLKGKALDAEALPASKFTVFVAGGSNCPMLRQYIPTLNELSRKWQPRGVNFYLLDETDTEAKAFRAEFKSFRLNFPAYLDGKQELARRLELEVTTKVAVIDNASGKIIYSGAIDDQYSFEGRRPSAGEHTLDANLEAALNGKPLPFGQRGAIGCAITLR